MFKTTLALLHARCLTNYIFSVLPLILSVLLLLYETRVICWVRLYFVLCSTCLRGKQNYAINTMLSSMHCIPQHIFSAFLAALCYACTLGQVVGEIMKRICPMSTVMWWEISNSYCMSKSAHHRPACKCNAFSSCQCIVVAQSDTVGCSGFGW